MIYIINNADASMTVFKKDSDLLQTYIIMKTMSMNSKKIYGLLSEAL